MDSNFIFSVWPSFILWVMTCRQWEVRGHMQISMFYYVSTGEGHGNPFRHSCLENPWTEEPGGYRAWRATVHVHCKSDTTEGLSSHARTMFQRLFSIQKACDRVHSLELKYTWNQILVLLLIIQQGSAKLFICVCLRFLTCINDVKVPFSWRSENSKKSNQMN